MNTLVKLNKQINMIFVGIVLGFFYVVAFGLAKVMYMLLHKPNKSTHSYWITHIENKTTINYDSPY